MADDNKEIPVISSLDRVSGKKDQLTKRPIDKDTKEWSQDLDISLPINGSEIPNFKAWVNWNGFHLNRETGKGHDGFDFAAYVTTDNKIVLGLPEDTKIYAIADGLVKQILDTPELVGGEYGVMISVEHGKNDSGMFSQYIDIKPTIEVGARVKKGDVIGQIYKDPDGDEGRLAHLHLCLTSGWGIRGTSIAGGGVLIRRDDPALIDRSLYKFNADPQGSVNFTVPNLPNAKVELVHFKRVKIKT